MKKWIIAGLAVLVVLSVTYASYSFLSSNTQAEVREEVEVAQAVRLININTAIQAELLNLKGVGTTNSEQVVKVININTASQVELQGLKGIGPVISKRIIEGRPYSNISDIIRVKGIGPKKFARMKDIISVN